MLDRPDRRYAGDICQLLRGAFQTTGERFENLNRDFRFLPDDALHVFAFIFGDRGGGAGFDCAGARLTEYVAHLSKDRAGKHEDVEQQVVFINLDGAFFQNEKARAFVTLANDGCADAKFLSLIHSLNFGAEKFLWQCCGRVGPAFEMIFTLSSAAEMSGVFINYELIIRPWGNCLS